MDSLFAKLRHHLISSTRKIYSRDAPCRGRDEILDPRAVLRSSDFDAIARKSKCHHSFKIKSCLTYGLTCWIFWGCTNEKGKNSKKLRNEYVTYLVHAWIHYTCPRIHHKKILRFCCFMWVFISHSLIARVQCFFLSACLVIWTTIGLKFSRFRCEGFC